MRDLSATADSPAPEAGTTRTNPLFEGGRGAQAELAAIVQRHLEDSASGAWDGAEIRLFQERLRQVREFLGYSPRLLEEELGFWSDGKYVRMMEGQWPSAPLRIPSRRFLERLLAWLQANPEPVPGWSPIISLRSDQAGIPLRQILADKRQCPECVVEWLAGRRGESETWWVYGHPRQRFCSRKHQRQWHRRDEAERQRVLALMSDKEEDGQ